MGSNRFGISVLLQSLFLAITGAAGVLVISGDYLLITKASFTLLWILQILVLIWFVNKTNRELAGFLDSLKHLDKVKLSGSGRSFRRLNLTYNQIIEIIRKERAAREAEYQYFRDTIAHINTGLIAITGDGKIDIINRAAMDILSCSACSTVEQLGEKVNESFPGIIDELEPGRPRMVSFALDGKIIKLSLNLALLKIQDEYVKLISIVDIKGELEEGELEAWQKLIRVLTHEIVNSVTPINTLTTAMLGKLERSDISGEELNRNLSSGIRAIGKRNQGLLAFVENFQRINKVPEPRIQTIQVIDLFDNLRTLLKEDLKQVELTIDTPDKLYIKADEDLIIQLLINLVKNAVEAGAGRIEIIAETGTGERPEIRVTDNGKGIDPENIDRIFIPFYSTKKEGSGIGLGLSRQIMRLHRGNITVESTPGQGASFTLKF